MKEDYLGIKINTQDPAYIDEFSSKLLDGYYLKAGETVTKALARPAAAFCYGDYELAQRIYDYAYKGWFMYASPILSNAPVGSWVDGESKTSQCWHNKKWEGEVQKSMPISCFAMVAPDTIKGQVEAITELSLLSVAGGGVGIHNQIRAATEKAPSPIPYMKVIDGVIGYYRQSKTRRGACAYYMDVSHPDIVEHIKFRIPSQGDSARKSDNRSQFHNAVNVTDDFIKSVNEDLDWNLVCPHNKDVRETVKARKIWECILEARELTGEPYIFKIDTAQRALPETQKKKGLKINGSNICIEICLPTDEERTFVCCLSSLNLEYFEEWKDSTIVEDLVKFLDNVIEYFINNADISLSKSVFSASQERAIGIGTMGFASFLQKKMIAFESGGFNSAAQWNNIIFKHIKDKAVLGSEELAKVRGEPGDMIGSGRRNSALLAIAPNANNSIIVQTSASIEPIASNAYTHTTRAGSFLVKNKFLEALFVSKGIVGKDLGMLWQDIVKRKGTVQHLDVLTKEEKDIFKTAFELDQHWVVEHADKRGEYVCQSQSLNLFFPAGSLRKYINSVHLKALNSEFLKSLYYFRTEKEVDADIVKEIQRKALVDWNSDECVACSG